MITEYYMIDQFLIFHKLAHQRALSLASKIGYTTKETIKILITKASLQAKALNSVLEPRMEENIKKTKTAEMNLKKADYGKDSEKAKEILDRIKDEGEIRKYKEPEAKPSHINAKDLIRED